MLIMITNISFERRHNEVSPSQYQIFNNKRKPRAVTITLRLVIKIRSTHNDSSRSLLNPEGFLELQDEVIHLMRVDE